MRVRKQSATGDYVFGRGSEDFFVNDVDLVGQRIQTRLLLWEGEWFLDQTAGTPWLQQVLGYGHQTIRDQVIKTIILETPGVTSIESFSATENPVTRKYTVQGTVMTQFSTTQTVSFGPVLV